MNQPNIILMMVDQMRGDCIGADGNTFIETPNLDYLPPAEPGFDTLILPLLPAFRHEQRL